jgi:hypothetical protein
LIGSVTPGAGYSRRTALNYCGVRTRGPPRDSQSFRSYNDTQLTFLARGQMGVDFLCHQSPYSRPLCSLQQRSTFTEFGPRC